MAKQNKKVFVVDDDRFHLEMMDQILRNIGFEDIALYTNGLDALKDIHLNPTVVFLDHQMEEFQGFEILRKMKRSNPDIFVVMISAQEEIQVAVSSLKYGAIDYLQKDMALESNIKDVLERIEKLREVLRAKKPSLLKSILNVL